MYLDKKMNYLYSENKISQKIRDYPLIIARKLIFFYIKKINTILNEKLMFRQKNKLFL